MSEDNRAALKLALAHLENAITCDGVDLATEVLQGLLDSAPRVFFPGDTIPPFVTVMSVNGQIEVGERWSWENEDKDPWIEIWTPEPDALQAAVEQAREARANAEWQHTEGVTP